MNKVTITIDLLTELLSFEENLENVEIKKTYQLGNNAVMIICILTYPDDIMTVPVIWYDGKDYLFTPCDWQGKLPKTPRGITSIDWRINDTDIEAVMFNGLPMLPPGVPEPGLNPIDSTRLYIGSVIRKAREEAGLTLRQLADKCNIRFSHIARIERGKNNSNIDTVANIAAALGLKLSMVMSNGHVPADLPPQEVQAEIPNIDRDETPGNPDSDIAERTDNGSLSNVSCGS